MRRSAVFAPAFVFAVAFITLLSISNTDLSGQFQQNVSAFGTTQVDASTPTGWSIVTSPNSGTAENDLYGVTCVSASDCWAVGDYYNNFVDQTLIEHWNGISWSVVVPSPNFGTVNNHLYGVACASTSNCWAVSDITMPAPASYRHSSSGGTGPRGQSLRLLTIARRETGSICRDMHFDIKLLGRRVHVNGRGVLQTLIEQWNGTSWSIVSAPSFAANSTLSGVTCASASDCWAVGDYSPGRTLAEHWDGASWSIISSPNFGSGVNLSGVACASASDCWTVGNYFAGYPQYRSNVHRALGRDIVGNRHLA